MKFKSQYENLLKMTNTDDYKKTIEYKKKRELTAFYPMNGHEYEYDKELMVVGRAVNGWPVKWRPEEIYNKLEDILKNIYLTSVCPMSWVVSRWGETKVYNTKKSVFWKVIKKTLEDLKIMESKRNWSSYIVWTNLYKIAPNDGGNPSKVLMKIQRDICNDLLEQEINHFQPKRILFIT